MLRALDLFCGAGGATKGLQRSGFHVTGVDIKPQPRYCGDAFHQADALTFPLDYECPECQGTGNYYRRDVDGDLIDCGDCESGRKKYDFIWASPPCQAYSVSRSRPKQAKDYPELVEPVRERLADTGVPFVIENVPGAPLMMPFVLCGAALNLGARCEDGTFRPLRRHRLFESNIFMLGTGCVCGTAEKCGVYGNGGGWANRFAVDRKGYKGNAEEMRASMGVDWMTIAEVSESIPPAYSEFIGRQIIESLR